MERIPLDLFPDMYLYALFSEWIGKRGRNRMNTPGALNRSVHREIMITLH